MRKIWQDEAWEDYLYWQRTDRNILKRINRLIADIERNGYRCIGKPEPLKYDLSGFWSVRIDEETVLWKSGNVAHTIEINKHDKIPRS